MSISDAVPANGMQAFKDEFNTRATLAYVRCWCTVDGEMALFTKIWRNSFTVFEYRAPYDSNLKVFKRLPKPEDIEFDDLVTWFKENMQGSWKLVIDAGVQSNNECRYLYEAFSLLVSREEDFMLYKLTWM